jgi:hypothetical protein
MLMSDDIPISSGVDYKRAINGVQNAWTKTEIAVSEMGKYLIFNFLLLFTPLSVFVRFVLRSFTFIEKLLASDVDIEALSRRIPVNTYSQDWGKLGAVSGVGGGAGLI